MKKDMKKLVSIVLTGIMCISLAGCAGNQEAKNPNPGGDSTEVTIKIMSWLADPVQSGIEKMNQEFMDAHLSAEKGETVLHSNPAFCPTIRRSKSARSSGCSSLW